MSLATDTAAPAVTPFGVRDGDPVALSGLVERRGRAVLAYSGAVAAPGRAREAAADAFGRFRSAVVDAHDPLAIDPERELRRCVRLAAAARAPEPERSLVARRAGHVCALVPELLAARAEGTLTPADADRLARHVERCSGCRSAEERFVAAEHAYRDAPDDPPDQATATELMRALFAAAPVAGVIAPEPVEPEPVAGPEPVAEAEPEPVDAEVDAEPDAQPTVAAVAIPAAAPARSRLRRGLALLAPAAVILVGLAVALVIAGVFSGPPGPAEQAADPAAATVPTPPPATATATTARSSSPAPARKAKSKSTPKATKRKKRINDQPSAASVMPTTTSASSASQPAATPAAPASPTPAPVRGTPPAPTPAPRVPTRSTTQATAPAPKQTATAGAPEVQAPPPSSAPSAGSGFTPSE